MLLHYLKKEPWVMDKLRQEQTQVCSTVSTLYCNTRCLLWASQSQACCDIQDKAADPFLRCEPAFLQISGKFEHSFVMHHVHSRHTHGHHWLYAWRGVADSLLKSY